MSENIDDGEDFVQTICCYCLETTFVDMAINCKGFAREEYICSKCKDEMRAEKKLPYCGECYPDEDISIEDEDKDEFTPNQNVKCFNCGATIWTGSFEIPTQECPKCGVLFGTAPSGTLGIGGEADFGPNEDFY